MKKEEDELCKKFWIQCQQYSVWGKLNLRAIWHNNNGEHSGTKIQRIIAGKRAKSMGQQRGLLDYTCVATNGKHFYLEFKFGKNSLTPEQKEFIEFQERCGNECLVVSCKDYLDTSNCLQKTFDFLVKNGILKT